VQSVQEITNELKQLVGNLEIEVRNTETWRKGVSSFAAELLDLSSYFNTLPGDLAEVSRNWAEGQRHLRNPKLLTALRLDSAYWKTYESMDINSCHFNRREGRLTFDVNRTIDAPELRILQASPFTLQSLPMTTGGGKNGLRIEYTGPSHVIYNSTSHCLLPYGGSPDSNLGLLPPAGTDRQRCGTPSPINFLNYWTSTCLPIHSNDVSSTQLKLVDDSVYIYCSGHSISVYKKTVPCPAYVFSVHMNESFSFQVDAIID
jgi:hypothetical protein